VETEKRTRRGVNDTDVRAEFQLKIWHLFVHDLENYKVVHHLSRHVKKCEMLGKVPSPYGLVFHMSGLVLDGGA
jgi:hypothetical protein